MPSQTSLGIIPNIMSRAKAIEIDNRVILTAVVVATLLLFPLVAFTSGGVRIVFGLIFALFSPGYALISAIFPKRDKLGGIERIALSLSLSIAVVPLIGFILNFTPWGIELYPIVISVTVFILAASVVGWYRQRKLGPDQRFKVVLKGPG